MKTLMVLLFCTLILGCQTTQVDQIPVVEDDKPTQTEPVESDSPLGEDLEEDIELLEDEDIDFDSSEFEDW